MFSYSHVHNWQGEEAVKQILVFNQAELKNEFDNSFLERIEKDGIRCASDSNIGAIYKLRAVKNGDNKWLPVIRCGFSGLELYEGPSAYDTWDKALFNAHAKLINGLAENSSRDFPIRKIVNLEEPMAYNQVALSG